jgi:hypothetical protein
MNRHRTFQFLTLLSIVALPLGTVACNHASPTEPGFDDQPAVAASTLSSATGASHGGDDPAGDDHGGTTTGTDDQPGDDQGRHGRGADDPAGDDHGQHRNGRDDNPKAPKAGQQLRGAVASVGQGSLTLTNGTRILVNAQTQWNTRGDLRSLDQVAAAVAAHRPTRVEGRGTRQADGSVLALTLKAEVDN